MGLTFLVAGHEAEVDVSTYSSPLCGVNIAVMVGGVYDFFRDANEAMALAGA